MAADERISETLRPPASGRRWTVVRFGLGGLLLIAAGLKFYGLSVSAVPPVGWFAQPWLQLAAVEWEVVLGLWLLSGVLPHLAWSAALGTFLAFAGVSGYLGWVGVASCGCFGAVQASPWWAFGVDLTAVALLAISRPRPVADVSHRGGRLVRGGLGWAACILILFAGVAAGGTWYAGSPGAAVALLRGEAITTTLAHLDFGSGAVGTVLTAQVELTNWSGRPIRLVGGTSDCSCVTHQDLPVTIPPGESRPVTIMLRVPPAANGQMTRQAQLFTDHDQQPRIHLTLSCWVN